MQNIQKDNAKLFYHTCHIPLAVYDCHLQILCSYGLMTPPIRPLGDIDLANEIRTMKMSYKNIMTPFQEHYMLLRITGPDETATAKVEASQTTYYLLAGPFLHKSGEFSIEKLMQKNQIPLAHANAVRSYFAELPDVVAMDVPYYYQLLERIFQVSDGQFSDSCADLFPSVEIETRMLEYSGIDFTHHNYYYEQGRMENLLSDTDLMTSAKNLEDNLSFTGTLASNEERNLKNLAVILISMMGRFAIENGLDSHLSFTMIDTYLQMLEDSNNISDLAILLTDYARKLQKTLKLSRNSTYSIAIRRALTYIDNHLTSHISLEDAARHVHLTSGYLSILFKKETGETFSTCLMRKRIKEAQKMLDYTNYTLQNISDTLCFSSKSHFCKCFKKYAGMTPTQYKERKK